MRNYTKETLINTMKLNRRITVDSDGKLDYIAVRLHDDELEMTEAFKQELIKSGLYGTHYMTGFALSGQSLTVRDLPIYGQLDRWATKTIEESVNSDLNDRHLRLLKRVNDFNEYTITK